jgi:hypothetical protein
VLRVSPMSRAVRRPSARCGVSFARKAASAGVKSGLDLSRCRHMKPQHFEPTVRAALSSSPRSSGSRISW